MTAWTPKGFREKIVWDIGFRLFFLSVEKLVYELINELGTGICDQPGGYDPADGVHRQRAAACEPEQR